MISNKKMISIIVPIYKAEDYIDRCIKSLVNQTYKNIEIILIDDESPDNCPVICEKWAEKDERIKVFHKDNKGVADARRLGVDLSNGEYIMFVDSDDWVRADICEYMLSLIESGEHQIACCGYCLTRSNDEPAESTDEMLTIIDFEKSVKGLYDYSLWSIWAKLYDKRLFDIADIPHIDLMVSEDLLTNFYLFRKCTSIIISSKDKYFYFRHSGSVMTKLPMKRIEDQLTAYKTICNELQEGTMAYTYSVANRLLNDFQLLNSVIYNKKGYDYIKPIAKDIKECRSYVFSRDTDYCLGLKYKLSTLLLSVSPRLYALMIRLSGKKY